MMAGLQFCGQRGSLVWDVLKNPVFYNQKAENIVKKKVQSLQEILKKNRVSISIRRSAAEKTTTQYRLPAWFGIQNTG